MKKILLILALFGLASAAELTGTLKKISDTNTINIGYRETGIPFSYLDGNQKPIGYSMDLCMIVVQDLKKLLNKPNLKINLVNATYQTRMALVANGTIDMECAESTHTKEREKQVDFSYHYFYSAIRMLVKSDSKIANYPDLSNKTIITPTGTTSDVLLRQMVDKKVFTNTKITYSKDIADAFVQLESGRADAFIVDDILLASLRASSKNPAGFKIVGDAASIEPYGIMMRKDPEFKKVVNESLARAFKSGEAKKIYAKWFMNKVPPKGINMELPMSKQLEEGYAKPSDVALD